MILWRVLPADPAAKRNEPGGSLFFPRPFQGTGRHDNPRLYGCVYLSTEPKSAVVEAIARFRGATRLEEDMLVRGGRGLALAELHLRDDAELIDLDEPRMLSRQQLQPSTVATHDRKVTQAYAARIFRSNPQAAGIRWWSTFESSWINVTLFGRAARRLRAREPEGLSVNHPTVAEAAKFLGLA